MDQWQLRSDAAHPGTLRAYIDLEMPIKAVAAQIGQHAGGTMPQRLLRLQLLYVVNRKRRRKLCLTAFLSDRAGDEYHAKQSNRDDDQQCGL